MIPLQSFWLFAPIFFLWCPWQSVVLTHPVLICGHAKGGNTVWFTALYCSRKDLDKWKPQVLISKGACWWLLTFSDSLENLKKGRECPSRKMYIPTSTWSLHTMWGALQLREAHPVPPKCPGGPGSSEDRSSVLPWTVSHTSAAAEKQSKPQVVSISQPPLRQEVPKPGNKNCFKELGKTKTKQPVVYRQPVGKWEMAELIGHILWAPQGFWKKKKKKVWPSRRIWDMSGEMVRNRVGEEWCWKCYWVQTRRVLGAWLYKNVNYLTALNWTPNINSILCVFYYN